MYNSIPLDLKSIDQWVNWCYKSQPGEVKPTKIPLNPRTLLSAKTNDRSTWASFEEAKKIAEEPGSQKGIGFVFTQGDPYIGIDLDNCFEKAKEGAEGSREGTEGSREGEQLTLKPYAREIVDLLDSYTEISPSGKGLHIIVMASTIDKPLKTPSIEIYPFSRYFCFTGNVFENRTAINRRLAQLLTLYPDSNNAVPEGLAAKDFTFPAEDEELHTGTMRNVRMTSLAGFLRSKGYGENQIFNAISVINKEGCSPPLGDAELRSIARSIAKYKAGETWKGCSRRTNYNNNLVGPDNEPGNTLYQENQEEGRPGLVLNKLRQVKAILTNAKVLLERKYKNISTDEFTGEITFENEKGEMVVFDDVEKIKALEWLEDDTHMGWKIGVVREALIFLGNKNKRDSLISALNAIPPWDGNHRLNNFVSSILTHEQRPEYELMGRHFWLQLVARGLNPGCQADMVLLLIGKQGFRKTQFCREVSLNPEWTLESAIPRIEDKDMLRALQGRQVIEFPELTGFIKSENEHIKNFITRKSDSYTPKYMEGTINRPRRCIFISTTNDSSPLRDTDGNRRYWPIYIDDKRPINLELFRKCKEQLYAEAIFWYKDGEPWWNKGNVYVEEITDLQEQASSQDSIWHKAHLTATDLYTQKSEITTWDVGVKLMGRDSDINKSLQIRIGIGLQKHGWVKKRRKEQVNGKRVNVTYYEPSEQKG